MGKLKMKLTDSFIDNGYESFIQSMAAQENKTVSDEERNSTPSDEDEITLESPSEKFKQFLHQRKEIIDKLEVTLMEDDEGFVVDNESGDESLCVTKSIEF